MPRVKHPDRLIDTLTDTLTFSIGLTRMFIFLLQGVANPVPRVKHPDWLQKKLLEKDDVFKQKRINEMFNIVSKGELLERQVSVDVVVFVVVVEER